MRARVHVSTCARRWRRTDSSADSGGQVLSSMGGSGRAAMPIEHSAEHIVRSDGDTWLTPLAIACLISSLRLWLWLTLASSVHSSY